MKIFHLYTSFSNDGGAQRVAWDLYKNLMPNEINYLCGETEPHLCIKKFQTCQYVKFSIKTVIENKDAIFISHHRKLTTYLMLLNKTFYRGLKIIHVSHNEFNSGKILTFFPDTIIAVSYKVRENLVDYFNLNCQNINVIKNGLQDRFKSKAIRRFNPHEIKILYPARINSTKQQILIVENVNKKLNPNISIDFAGDGEDKLKLENICRGNSQFRYLGYVNIDEIIDQYDFVMLFTKKEGLPLSLIEACMFQKPILANDVGGNIEVLNNGYNGFLLSDFSALSSELNKLVELTSQRYSVLATNARNKYLTSFLNDEMYSKYRKIITGIP